MSKLDKQIIKDEDIAKAINDGNLIEPFLETKVWKEVIKPWLEGKEKESMEALVKRDTEEINTVFQIRGVIRTYRGIINRIEKGFIKEKSDAIDELKRKESREKRKY
jgi:hypothetical protein